MLKLQLFMILLFIFSACSTKKINEADAIHICLPEFSIEKNIETVNGGFFYKNQLKTDASNNTNLGTTLPCLNSTDFTLMKSACMSRAKDAHDAYKPPESIEFEVEKMDAYLKEHNIDLKTILSFLLRQQIQQLAGINNKIKAHANAKLKVAILKYGLDEVLPTPGLFSPMLSVKATLTDANEEVLWEKTQFVNNSEVPKIKYAEYYAQPENFQTAWESAANIVVNKLMIDLQALDSDRKNCPLP